MNILLTGKMMNNIFTLKIYIYHLKENHKVINIDKISVMIY